MDLVSLFYTQVIPIGLWIVMLGLGLALTPRDIRNLIVMPKAISVALLGQLVLLPILAFGLAVSLAPTPAIAVGAVILAACPGGVTSNAYSFASRGDVALSVTLTAVSSFVTIFTVPLITYLALEYFFAAGATPDLPVAQLMWMLAKLTVLPVAIGMILRQLIVTGSLLAFDLLRQTFLQTAAVAISLNVFSMAMGRMALSPAYPSENSDHLRCRRAERYARVSRHSNDTSKRRVLHRRRFLCRDHEVDGNDFHVLRTSLARA